MSSADAMPVRTVLVTGANGFVGKHLCIALSLRKDLKLLTHDLGDGDDSLAEQAKLADVVFHLAGVNRPNQIEDFFDGNTRLTQQLVTSLEEAGGRAAVILSSSAQAALDNPYGRSKLAAEEVLFSYGARFGANAFVYRLPNLFGKWCRPNYNSVVATFCHNIARDLPIQVNDPAAKICLVYIDDLIDEFMRALDGRPTREGAFCAVPEVHETTVGQLAEHIHAFKASRADLSIPDQQVPLLRDLYSTYLSSLPCDAFNYPLKMNQDERGSFTEFIRTPDRGQVSVNISRPGIVKGNHWHHTKNEKFLVVSGEGLIQFRKLGTAEIISYHVSGERMEVVDIPPGYTHSITNQGKTDMVTLMWVNESYDPTCPDTWYEQV